MEIDLDLRFARHSTDRECADCGQTFTPLGRERVCPYCDRQERDAARNRERAL